MGEVARADAPKTQFGHFVTDEKGQVSFKPVKVPSHVLERRAEQKRRHELQMQVRINRERSAVFNPGTILFCVAIGLVFAVTSCGYIMMQSEINTRLSAISSLEQQISTLQTDNDLTEKRMALDKNLDDIRIQAANELGMGEADQSQIKYYTVDETEDYMTQYNDVD